MAAPIPSMTGGASGPATSGATTGAYGMSSSVGDWIVNIGGGKQTTATGFAINWMYVAGAAAVVGLLWWKTRK